MPESLLSGTQVRLFGRPLAGVTLTYSGPGGAANLVPDGLGANRFLRGQLALVTAQLARIYAITHEGKFYSLPKPAIFLVHGGGTPVTGAGTFSPGAGNQPLIDESGMVAREFVWESDVVFWVYDKEDVSLRLDAVAGRLDEILVDAVLSATSKYSITSRSDLTARHRLSS